MAVTLEAQGSIPNQAEEVVAAAEGVAAEDVQLGHLLPQASPEKRAEVLEACNKEFGLTGSLRMVPYEGEQQLGPIMELITKDLSEPYSIYTYRYFLTDWPHLAFLVKDGDEVVGCIVCKLDYHRATYRGYIAMLAVANSHRGKRLGTALVVTAIRTMILDNCDEVVLEAEVSNLGALRLYENLGFVRAKRLFRYYLNGVDAFRLKLWLR
eukprot:comp82459_c0_seq1/m.48412 comp82459_c0_seq1/g.48412  ORF comp82459_c0_seq1/g.48412 comp82459_c0_seq1/m.48412 type:complete len:210 (-) comp82459_c0_seq1:163-792(-)